MTVLQVGADIYCETRRIAAYLEDVRPDPSLFPPGSQGLSDALAGWVEHRVFVTTGPARFQSPDDVDILMVGAGVSNLAAATRLHQVCEERGVEFPSVLVIEKAMEIGSHQLSGAAMDSIGLQEHMPEFLERGLPFHYKCTSDYTWLLSKKRKFSSPITPPPFVNHGNCAISLSDMVKWLSRIGIPTGVPCPMRG